MDQASEQADQVDQPAEAMKPREAKYWHDKLKDYKTRIDDKWGDQCKNLDRLYSRSERPDNADREYSIFWANIEVLRPAVYSRPPVPVVVPRFKQSNPIASGVSEVLERCLVTIFDQSDIDGCLREVRDEALRYSRGTARVRFDQDATGTERIAFDHVAREDFACDGDARTWNEVKWVGFRAWLTRDKLVKRFGAQMAAQGLDVMEIPLKRRDKDSALDSKEDQAPIWEIWCKETGLVHFVCEDYQYELDTQQPWLELTSFWPCPRPIFGTMVPNSVRPVPDILQYKDQIEEINTYTARIAALSEVLRMKGFYPAGAGEVSDAIETAIKSIDDRAVMVPVSSAAALGGTSFKDVVVWLPVEQVLTLIKGLVELRRVIIDDVYQITGISDIVRGATEASETATAQKIKAQWGSARIRERQIEMMRFARDLGRIAGEIVAENFSPQTILQMAQLPVDVNNPQAAAVVQQGVALLRQDKARGFTIDIETDSTIQADEDAEKQRRTEFVQAVGTVLQQAGPMVMQVPALGPFVGEVLKFVAQGFRAGRPMEQAIDQLSGMLQSMGQQGGMPGQNNADQQKQQVQQQSEETKLQTAQVRAQAEQFKAQAGIQQTQMDMQRSVMEHHQGMQRLQAQALMPPIQQRPQ